ncbi:MAG: hypothetical protein FWB99_00785 [Treponema sp.]|nr:hypothetical protein [Treponema sp.]
MKNRTKFLGVVAVMAIIGFTMTSCGGGGGGGGGGTHLTPWTLTIHGLDEYMGEGYHIIVVGRCYDWNTSFIAANAFNLATGYVTGRLITAPSTTLPLWQEVWGECGVDCYWDCDPCDCSLCCDGDPCGCDFGPPPCDWMGCDPCTCAPHYQCDCDIGPPPCDWMGCDPCTCAPHYQCDCDYVYLGGPWLRHFSTPEFSELRVFILDNAPVFWNELVWGDLWWGDLHSYSFEAEDIQISGYQVIITIPNGNN